MLGSLLWILPLVALFGGCQGDRAEDLVDFLPGLEGPQPTFRHWAGYLNATNGRRFWYWFVESENDPATDPVVLWLNGGPGCSSMTGKLSELGPWRSHSNGSLTWFSERWNKIANMLFVDAPQCVGHSYTENWQDPDYCSTSDDETALDNHMALQDFFLGFPEFAANDFYITGESYAGYYVPVLSARVVDDASINFKGMAIGNGVCNDDLQDSAMVEFLWARGTFGSELYDRLVTNCCPDANGTYCRYFETSNPECNAAKAEVYNIGWNSGMNPYDMYAKCYPSAVSLEADGGAVVWETDTEIRIAFPEGLPMSLDDWEKFQQWLDSLEARGKTIYSGIPCTDTSDRENYLRRADVRTALHIPSYVPQWEACSDNLRFTRQYTDVSAEYTKVLDAGHRVTMYYGDTDIACNHHGGRWFAEELGRAPLTDYDLWLYNDENNSTQVAGFAQEWENLAFCTIRGSGHMVPTDTPIRGYDVFEKFIYDTRYH